MIIQIDKLKLSESHYNDLINASTYISSSTIHIDSHLYKSISLNHKYDNLPKTNYTGSIRGFGDIVYKIANPIAGIIDKVANTNISGCNSCAQRREALNRILPL